VLDVLYNPILIMKNTTGMTECKFVYITFISILLISVASIVSTVVGENYLQVRQQQCLFCELYPQVRGQFAVF
jgi:hypothetical protein